MIHVPPERVIEGDITQGIRESARGKRGGGGGGAGGGRGDDHLCSKLVLELVGHGAVEKEDEEDSAPLTHGNLDVVRVPVATCGHD